MAKPLAELVHPTWAQALTGEEGTIAAIGEFLRAETAAGRPWLPAGAHILRAFTQPLPEVRVLIVGQDPYPTPGHAIGLAFAVGPEVRPLPRSLQNIFTELTADLNCPAPIYGDLSAWAAQGVLLLNRVLTVQTNVAGSHRGIGWEQVTNAAINALVQRVDQPLVAILWGKDAEALIPALVDVPIIASAHPSPLSAHRGFFGSKPFSRANRLLGELGAAPIAWSRA